MMHNHHLSRAVANVSWNMFANMLAYKCLSYGKKLIRVNPKYTSQTCMYAAVSIIAWVITHMDS